ncbi:hypothetical protein D9615_004687 [Tricholomella constricta]|uniref:F-box domain-containing protein n=1 Tax=Tricholomella constricta TaxID=117010 RepID=A0A8H5M443_9AGAR|nr:hypothetical protein D9615_004687 [Tricholomella constricta]
MSTVTVTELRHIRPRRLSLIISSGTAPVLTLPVELVFNIFEAAIFDCKPSNLALVSKAFSKVVDAILYRTVILDSPNTVRLFHRTIHSKTRPFLTGHVKRLVVTWWPDSDTSQTQIHDIISACAGIRALISPSFRWPINISAAKSSVESGLTAITIQSFDEDHGILTHVSENQPLIFSKTLTHLRFCEPSAMWYSPTSMLAAFGPFPHLSHLQLARRANANESNDIMFANSVRKLLHSLPALKMLVVSVFPEAYCFEMESVENSDIWKRMCEIRSEDRRVIVLPGRWEEWKDGYEKQKLFHSGYQPADFWTRAANTVKAD